MADPRNHKTIDVGQVAGIESTVSGPLSWSPRLFFYHKFFTPDECNHIIKLGTTQTHTHHTTHATFLVNQKTKLLLRLMHGWIFYSHS
jgi:hypothetical protein